MPASRQKSLPPRSLARRFACGALLLSLQLIANGAQPAETDSIQRQLEADLARGLRAKAEAQACRKAPRRDLWSVAAGKSTVAPTTCQQMLAFEEALLAKLRLGSRSSSSCRLIRPEGCSFRIADVRLEVQMHAFAAGNCRTDGICAVSAKITCDAYVRGRTNAGSSAFYCIKRELMPSWSYATAGRFLPLGSNRWKFVPASESVRAKAVAPKARPVEQLCPEVIQAATCPP